IAERYQAGIEGVLAVDLQTLIAKEGSAHDQEQMAKLGLDGLHYLVLEQSSDGDVTRRQAVLSFSCARHGVASWIAAPAPMGALYFCPADSTAVAAFVTKEPSLLIEDVLAGFTAEERAKFDADQAKF